MLINCLLIPDFPWHRHLNYSQGVTLVKESISRSSLQMELSHQEFHESQSSIPGEAELLKDKETNASFEASTCSTVSNSSQLESRSLQLNLSSASPLLPILPNRLEHCRSRSGNSEIELQKDITDDTNAQFRTNNSESDVSPSQSSMKQSLALLIQRPLSARTYRKIYETQCQESLASPTDSEGSIAEIPYDAIDDTNVSLEASTSDTAILQLPVTDVNFSPNCIDCVKPFQVVEGDEIQAGDHIVFAGAVYDHHAIVISVKPTADEHCSEKKRQLSLVHASNTMGGVSIGITKFFGGKAKILKTDEEVDFQKTKTLVVKYFNNKFTPEEIVQRAISEQEKFGTNDAKFKYNLFENNCEHFATWCVTDQRLSVQVRKFRMIISMVWSIGWEGIGDETKRNDAAYYRGLLCEPCYERNKKLFAVPKQPIRHSTDVSVGDIITYSYYTLRHDSIVMEIKTSSQCHLEVLVAHYAFCGFFAHRTIVQELLVIPFDGSISVTDYSSSGYSIYPPEEVVERARSRLGEQLFIFFANDSCHFARWCKLRRINLKAFTPAKLSQMQQKLNSGECDGCEVWKPLIFTNIPSLVTVWQPKLWILHNIMYM